MPTTKALEDAKAGAEIAQIQARTAQIHAEAIATLVGQGFSPRSAVNAVVEKDMWLLVPARKKQQ